MFNRDIHVIRVIHAERVERDVYAVRVAGAFPRAPRRSIGRAIGRSIVRVGAWVAAEQAPEPPLTWRPTR